MSEEISIDAESQRVERRKRLKKRLLIDLVIFGVLGIISLYLYELYRRPTLVFVGYEKEGRFAKFILRNSSLRTWETRMPTVNGKPQPRCLLLNPRGRFEVWNASHLPPWQTNAIRVRWYNSITLVARDLQTGDGMPSLSHADFVLAPFQSLQLSVPAKSIQGLVGIRIGLGEVSSFGILPGLDRIISRPLDRLWWALNSQEKHGENDGGEVGCYLPGAPTFER